MNLLMTILAAVIAAQAGPRTVIGNSDARRCFELAVSDQDGRISSIRTCRDALDEGGLARRDRAATLVNLGILLRRSGDDGAAIEAYDRAAELAPELAGVYVNRGVARLAMDAPRAAIADFDRALELEPGQPHQVHYNRAIGYEMLEDYAAAYADLQAARELAPDWAAPREALERYRVVEAPGG